MTTNLRSNKDIEPVPDSLKNKVGIEIVDVQKFYQPSCRSPPVAALNGWKKLSYLNFLLYIYSFDKIILYFFRNKFDHL